MAKSDIDVKALKEQAKSKAKQAKQAVAQQKKLSKQPNPQYVDMDNVDFVDNPEADSKLEIDEVAKGFRERMKDEGKRFALATDTEYWSCFCFQTREQCTAFLKALGIDDLGDKYIDGEEVARRMGIELPSADVPYNTSGKIDKSWLEFTN